MNTYIKNSINVNFKTSKNTMFFVCVFLTLAVLFLSFLLLIPNMAYGNNLFNAEAKCENNLNDAYKPIQYAIDDQSVTFLPAVSDASWAQSGLNLALS